MVVLGGIRTHWDWLKIGLDVQGLLVRFILGTMHSLMVTWTGTSDIYLAYAGLYIKSELEPRKTTS